MTVWLPSSGSRATVTWRFGFVALDILNVISTDAGVYTCRATNIKGYDDTSANLRITGGSLCAAAPCLYDLIHNLDSL